jgi:hypothetical protein
MTYKFSLQEIITLSILIEAIALIIISLFIWIVRKANHKFIDNKIHEYNTYLFNTLHKNICLYKIVIMILILLIIIFASFIAALILIFMVTLILLNICLMIYSVCKFCYNYEGPTEIPTEDVQNILNA